MYKLGNVVNRGSLYKSANPVQFYSTSVDLSWSFLTRRLRKQSVGFSGGADYVNDMQMIAINHL